MKNLKLIFTFLLIVFSVSLYPSFTHACMGFSCNSDVNILAEVMTIENGIATAKPFHVFPDTDLSLEEKVRIQNTDGQLKVGKKYALALNKKDDFYTTSWDTLEIEGNSFENAKLIELKNGDDALLQWWINTNGEKPEVSYYGINNKLFVRLGAMDSPFSRELQVYPEPLDNTRILLIALGSFFGGCLVTYSIARRKRS